MGTYALDYRASTKSFTFLQVEKNRKELKERGILKVS
jgi:hypothetical protein